MKITNNSDIPLALGVWLLHDEYDYINEPNYISVTKLMKPLKSLILAARVDYKEAECDLEDYISRALGHSLHDSIEKSWKLGHKKSLEKLGYPQHLIDRVLVNPTKEELAVIEDPIPVYLEQRALKEFMGFKIGGKYDMVADGIVHDNKSTTAYTWVFGDKSEDYILQGSLYRWLSPDIITEDFIRINFIFTDWQKMQARTNPKYPQKRLAKKEYPLLSLQETEDWVRNKLTLLNNYYKAPEENIPECTPDDLWLSASQYKYFKDPTKTEGRSTRNFTSLTEARKFQAEKGGEGIIKTIPGEAKRCAYCDAAPVCKQRLKYVND